jgi:hypothetical protein
MTEQTPGSLVALFAPPMGCVGDFGWLCGFSADAALLDLAADRFTALSRSQRQVAGRVHLAVLLDRGCEQLPPTAAPGALHLAARRPLPYRMLHAKLGLLAFVTAEGAPHTLRLIVCTGNWTRQTLEESLDLAWCLDLPVAELLEPQSAQAVADLRHARDLFAAIRALFVDDPLHATPRTSQALQRLDAQLTSLPAAKKGDPPPRLIDNRRESLLLGLTARVPLVAGEVRRDRVVLGSGFYGGGEPKGLPVAAHAVVKTLQEVGLLTTGAKVTLVVNPAACQEVAHAGAAMRAARWRAVPAADPSGDKGGLRSLHAKFVFSANRSRVGRATSGWIWLGSGNLTAPGFLRAAGANGNLEAGVVFALDPVAWDKLSARLPVDLSREDDINVPGVTLHPGEGPPERPVLFLAPPIAYLTLEEAPLRLRPPPGVDMAPWGVTLRTTSGGEVALAADGNFPWFDPIPAEVLVRWTEKGAPHEALVPVLDGFGRIAGRVLPPLSLDELEDELRAFPDPPDVADDDDDEPGGDAGERGGAGSAFGPRVLTVARYPVREVMQAVEVIAERQIQVAAPRWAEWCVRLEQALVRMRDDEAVVKVRELGVNPLAVLRRAEFRPDHSRAGIGDTLYLAALRRAEVAWRLEGLAPLGGDV